MTDKLLSYEEVWQHNLPEDCWMIINDYVYNVSEYINEHPGGPIVLQMRAGCVATSAFKEANHSPQAINNIMPKYVVGRIDKGTPMVKEQEERTSKGGNVIGVVALLGLVLILVYYLTR